MKEHYLHLLEQILLKRCIPTNPYSIPSPTPTVYPHQPLQYTPTNIYSIPSLTPTVYPHQPLQYTLTAAISLGAEVLIHFKENPKQTLTQNWS
jgi:hypothetical protein